MNPIAITYHQDKQIESLNGLRGVAILLVVLFHNFIYLKVTNLGWIGVDLFFVLSGFLITRILINTKDKPHYYKNFIIRRVLRIFPLYYLATLGCILAGLLIYHPLISSVTENAWYFLTYTQNFLFVSHNDFVPKTILNHFWSLCVEEHFYLLWPVLVYYFTIRRLLYIGLAVIVSSKIISVYMMIQGASWVPPACFSFTRFDSLISGAILAMLCIEQKALLEKYTLPALLTASFFLTAFYSITLFGSGFSAMALNPEQSIQNSYSLILLLNTIFFSCVLVLALCKSRLSDLLKSKPLVTLGKYSYGIYIYHLPLYTLCNSSCKQLFYELTGSNTLAVVSSSLLLTGLAIVIAFLSYHLIENKFILLKEKIAKY